MVALQSEYDVANQQLGECGENLNEYMARLSACKQENEKLKGQVQTSTSNLQLREEQISDLKEQINDIRVLRDM